jgi:hypothetical protein
MKMFQTARVREDIPPGGGRKQNNWILNFEILFVREDIPPGGGRVV